MMGYTSVENITNFQSETVLGPYKRTQTAAHQCLLPRRRSIRGTAVRKGEKESLVYCGWFTRAAEDEILFSPSSIAASLLRQSSRRAAAAPQLAVVG